MRDVVDSLGWSFEVASEQPRVMMDNVRFLAGYRRRAWVNESALRHLRTRKLDGASVGEAIHATQGARPLARAALLHMLWTQELRTDLSKVLSSRSILMETEFVMSGAGVRIGVGTRVMYDGAVHEVTEWFPTCQWNRCRSARP